MANHYSVFQFRDWGGETSNVKIFNGAITVGSLPGFLTAFGAMRAALEGITLGIASQESWTGDLTVLSAALPASQVAQRESKWLGRYHDTVTQKKYTFEVPTADLTGVTLLAGSDFADLTVAPMSTFKTNFDGFARCPDSDVNAVVLDSMQAVGRNL